MPVNHVVDYTENTFYHSFSHQSSATRIARWTKALLYCFIALQVFCILFEMLRSYCVTPPDLFMQFLFLLLMAGIIELINMQMSNITDHCILDYAKNMVTLIQQRFFIRKIMVLASFEQVRVIGVSSAPQNIFGNIFARTNNRYALVIMNDRNSFIQITEHELSLEDANVFALELSTRYMPSARLLMGESETELIADASTGDVSSRLVQQNLMSMIDATVLPTLQAFAGLLITAVIVASLMIGLNRVAESVFATDLMLAHQPVSQLFIRPEPRVEKKPVTSPDKTPDATVAPATATAEIATQSAPITSASEATQVARPPEDQQLATSAESPTGTDIHSETASTTVYTATTLYQASESQTITASPEPDATVAPAQTIASDSLSANPLEKPAELPPDVSASPTVAAAEPIPVPVADPFKVSYSNSHEAKKEPPLPLRDESSKSDTSVRPAPQLMPLPFNEPIQASIPEVSPAALQSLRRPAGSELTHLAASASLIEQISTAQPKPVAISTPATKAFSILAGHGILDVVELGDQVDKVLSQAGQPIAQNATGHANQYIFSGYSFISDTKTGTIKQINITRNSIRAGQCHTPQNFSVGSPLADIREHFGPPSIIGGLPGLHFPGLGISFIPSPSFPEQVGAIKIYPAGSRPD